MRIFLTKGSKLVENTEDQFLTEKEIQMLTEQNLHEIFKLEFVTSELQLPGFRIDILAFNKEFSAFYIIEYKKGPKPLSYKSRSALPQPRANS